MIYEGNSNFEESFSRKIKFHELYRFLKSHKEYVYNKDIPQSSCLCEICENAVFVAIEQNVNNRFRSNKRSPLHSGNIFVRFVSKRLYVFRLRKMLFYWYLSGGLQRERGRCEYSCWTKKDGKVTKIVKSISIKLWRTCQNPQKSYFHQTGSKS